MTVPLHGKRAYVRIKTATLPGRTDPTLDSDGQTIIVPEKDINWNVVSYATRFSFDLQQQNIARAIVMGTDGILDIESHGLLGVANVELILNDAQEVILSSLGKVSIDGVNADGAFDVALDYDKKITDALAGINFDGAVKVDIQIMPLTDYESFSEGDMLDANQSGYVYTIEDATVRSLSTRGAAGQYVTSSLAVEGGRVRISQKRKS